MANKFLDTFTDPNGTALSAHVPDFPAGLTWTISPIQQEIQSNGVISPRAVPSFDFPTVSAGITYAPGDEISCDITRSPVNTGLAQAILFCSSGGAGITSLRFELFNIDAANVGFGLVRFAAGFSFDEILATNPAMPTLALAVDSAIRLGIRIIDGTHFQLWREPAGGGARTTIFLNDGGTYTDGNGYWVTSISLVGDPALTAVGYGFESVGVGQSRKDNLMVVGAPWGPCQTAPGATSWDRCQTALGATTWGAC